MLLSRMAMETATLGGVAVHIMGSLWQINSATDPGPLRCAAAAKGLAYIPAVAQIAGL
jgi:hypothetical protein